MRVIRRTAAKRGDDMPLYGKAMRVKKHRYEVIIKFTKSKRVLCHAQITAPNVAMVKQSFAREYPTLTWGEPKYPKPKMVRHAVKQDTATRHDAGSEKVLRRRKKAVPRKVQATIRSD